jgi:hypothetical protein
MPAEPVCDPGTRELLEILYERIKRVEAEAELIRRELNRYIVAYKTKISILPPTLLLFTWGMGEMLRAYGHTHVLCRVFGHVDLDQWLAELARVLAA